VPWEQVCEEAEAELAGKGEPVGKPICSARRADRAATMVDECYGRPMDLSRITRDPAVMGGKPCIRGLRVTVGTIVGMLAADRSMDEILQAYPYLEREDIQAALAYAALRVQEIEVELKAP
jgi:uncharacterized protein (DUF433 family)